jgi:hypothetical protein
MSLEELKQRIKTGDITFEKASSDKIGEYNEYAHRVVTALGHPEAWVTDESMVADFMASQWAFDEPEEDDVSFDELKERLGIEVRGEEYIWEVAKRLKERENGS